VGVDFDSPYSASVSELPVGTYIVSAIATDNLGAESTNSIRITVTAPSVGLVGPRMSGGQFLFDASGLTAGRTNVLQTSTDFGSWISIETNVAAGSSATFTNAATAQHRFYRLLELVQ